MNRLISYLQANEMLLFNKKINAAEACERNLVAEVFPEHVFQQEAWDRVAKYAQLPPEVNILFGIGGRWNRHYDSPYLIRGEILDLQDREIGMRYRCELRK